MLVKFNFSYLHLNYTMFGMTSLVLDIILACKIHLTLKKQKKSLVLIILILFLQ